MSTVVVANGTVYPEMVRGSPGGIRVALTAIDGGRNTFATVVIAPWTTSKTTELVIDVAPFLSVPTNPNVSVPGAT
jgi:hypothetical protein